jgi:hypothetical protein
MRELITLTRVGVLMLSIAPTVAYEGAGIEADPQIQQQVRWLRPLVEKLVL